LALVLLPKRRGVGVMALARGGTRWLRRWCWITFGVVLGLVEREMTLPRVFGAVLLIAGVLLIQFGGTLGKSDNSNVLIVPTLCVGM